jgi:hypothetical protein
VIIGPLVDAGAIASLVVLVIALVLVGVRFGVRLDRNGKGHGDADCAATIAAVRELLDDATRRSDQERERGGGSRG